MKCPKCNFITFDFYDKCPKCDTDFTESKRDLNIIDYSLSDENNYLIPLEDPQYLKEKYISNVQTSSESKPIEVILPEKQSEPEIEHTVIENKKENEEIEGISLEDLLETTKIEEE